MLEPCPLETAPATATTTTTTIANQQGSGTLVAAVKKMSLLFDPRLRISGCSALVI